MDSEQLVSAAAGARMIGCHRATVWRWARRGLIEPVSGEPHNGRPLSDERWLYRLGDLIAVRDQMSQTLGARLRRGES